MPQLILAVDTSGKKGSIALARVTTGELQAEMLEVVALTGGAFSAQLVPEIAILLEKHGHSRKDLEAFAVVSGPGSFTGLRVGLAAIKALAEALHKPIVAISLLEAVACSGSRKKDRVLAALDAGRGDVYVGDYYAGDYELDPEPGTSARMHSERLLSREDFLAEAAQKAVITPDVAIAETARAAAIQIEQIDYPDAAVIARIGWRHLQSGETIRPEELEANYIRHSDAEIFSKPR
jgi:tRNA threonylcarbamoyladenosine biosynthesis protein TsaB